MTKARRKEIGQDIIVAVEILIGKLVQAVPVSKCSQRVVSMGSKYEFQNINPNDNLTMHQSEKLS